MFFTLLPALLCVAGTLAVESAPERTGVYPVIEAAFELPDLSGNPFDDIENDIRVTLNLPGGKSATALAFFDGGKTWRIRYTPRASGAYEVRSVTRNGKSVPFQSLSAKRFAVSGKSASGFVRIAPGNPLRFAFDDGTPYYPIGHNAAWKSGDTPDIPELFNRMGRSSENWSRVWMNHWDNKNLDWPLQEKLETGYLSLTIARHWDDIVRAAEKNGIYFQMTLQHHGQYSSTVNPNWGENPWNQKNGGFLEKPEEFFTSEKAKRLTRAKYRYIIARYGYSPNILAWELFNEVQFTDAVRNKQMPTVAAWHREMAAFIRGLDIQKHLVTTSSDTDLPELYDAMDYLQPHAYPPDVAATALSLHPEEWKKPIFFGEIGPGGDLNEDTGTALHNLLWASVVSESSGAAQYWTWDNLHRRDLYHHFPPIVSFVRAARIDKEGTLRTVHPEVKTPATSGSLSFAPGAGWASTKVTRFPILSDGTVQDIGKMPEYLQGIAHADMFPYAELTVTLEKEAIFRIQINESSKAGGHVILKRNGEVVAEKDFPPADGNTSQTAELSVTLPPGQQTLRLENNGADWVKVQRFTLTPYGPTLRVAGKGNASRAVLWIRNQRTDGPSEGTITMPGLGPGNYNLTWWNTSESKPASKGQVTVGADKRLTLSTPKIDKDIALIVEKRR